MYGKNTCSIRSWGDRLQHLFLPYTVRGGGGGACTASNLAKLGPGGGGGPGTDYRVTGPRYLIVRLILLIWH